MNIHIQHSHNIIRNYSTLNPQTPLLYVSSVSNSASKLTRTTLFFLYNAPVQRTQIAIAIILSSRNHQTTYPLPPGNVPQSYARAASGSGGAHVLGDWRAKRAAGMAGVLGIVFLGHGEHAAGVRHMDHIACGQHYAARSVSNNYTETQ